MNNKQIAIAKKALLEWFSEQKETAKFPPKIDYAFALQDEQNDNRIYFVFRVRKNALGKPWLAVAGGFADEQDENCDAAFSDFVEFPDKRDQAIALAFKTIDRAMMYKAQLKMMKAFENNMRYIKAENLDAEKIARQFVKTETRFFLTVGTVDVPSGKVIVADPLCYLAGEHIIAPVLKRKIPPASYPAEVSVCRYPGMGIRMCTARLKITEKPAVRYELAECEEETAAFKAKDGIMQGFPVDAGMMCFIDAKLAKNYAAFIEKWHKENPGKNHYDDYFAAFFAESYAQFPAYQREGGDFIEWTNPDSRERTVMIASGFGDGFYRSFWGFDESGEVCELVVPMVDADLLDN